MRGPGSPITKQLSSYILGETKVAGKEKAIRSNVKLLIERVNLRTLVAALIAAMIGLVLVFVSVSLLINRPVWQAFARELGALLFVSAVITLLWDLLGKRALVDEVLAKVQLSQDIKSSGITRTTSNFRSGDLNWDTYFQNVSEIDIFLSYGRTWRSTHLEKLRQMARNKKVRMRVVLPNPDNDETVRELARRFTYEPDELVRLIKEAEGFFRNLRQSGGGKIEVWFTVTPPLFSFYIFDRIAVVALFSHRPERTAVPAFVCEQGGYLYGYLREEFDAMVREGGLAQLTDEGET